MVDLELAVGLGERDGGSKDENECGGEQVAKAGGRGGKRETRQQRALHGGTSSLS